MSGVAGFLLAAALGASGRNKVGSTRDVLADCVSGFPPKTPPIIRSNKPGPRRWLRSANLPDCDVADSDDDDAKVDVVLAGVLGRDDGGG